MPIDVIQWRVRIGLFHSEGAYREMKRRCGCKHQKIKIKSLVGDVSFVVAVALLAIELIRAMMSHSITVLSRLQWKDVTEFFHTTLHSQWQQQDDKPSVLHKSAHRSMPNLITDLPSLTAVCIVVLHSVVRMLLLLSGDVEQNPGPEIILSVGDLPTLTNILRDAAPKWIAIGDELGFTDGDIKTLQNISQHTTGGDQSCFRELLAQWLKWAPPNHELPTLEKLASAVREAREERLAYGLTQKYQKKAAKDHLPQSPALSTDGESPHGGHSASATGNKTSQSPETAHNQSQPSSCSTAGESHHGSDGASATGYEGSHSHDDGTDKDLSLPHLDTSGLSYEQAEALKGRLIEETKWIMLQFQNVVTALKRSLEAQKVSVVDLAIHLSTLGAFSSVKLHKPVLDECLDKIKEANMGEAFWILRDYYSFFNYHIIEHLITGFCTEQDELYVQFQQYKQDFQKYCKRKCIECPVQFGCKSSVGQQKVTFTLDVNFQIYGIEELQAFRHRLAEILQVSEVTLCPCHVHPKRSIDLVFQVPTFVAEEIFHLSDEQESAMVAEGVVELECGEYYRWTKEEWIVSHSPTPLVLSDTSSSTAELQQQLVETERRAKQAEMRIEKTDLLNKQLRSERDKVTATLVQKEAQMERERSYHFKRVEELELELDKVRKKNAGLTAALEKKEAQMEWERKGVEELQLELDKLHKSESAGQLAESKGKALTLEAERMKLIIMTEEVKTEEYTPEHGQDGASQPLRSDFWYNEWGYLLSENECMIIAVCGVSAPPVKAVKKRPIKPGLSYREEMYQDIEHVQDLIRLSGNKELICTYSSFQSPGAFQSKTEYLRKIESFLMNCKKPGAIIWYTGDGQQDTGNWCFSDDVITLDEIWELYISHFRGRQLVIVSDCCYSGQWAHRLAEILDSVNVSACGHKAREKGILLAVFCSCQPHEIAYFACFSTRGALIGNNDGTIQFPQKKLTPDLDLDQTTCYLAATQVCCFRTPEESCLFSNPQFPTELQWSWKDILHPKEHPARYTYCVRGTAQGRQCWHCILVYKHLVEEFLAKVATGDVDVDVAHYGHVLYNGWGKDPPKEIKKKLYYRYH